MPSPLKFCFSFCYAVPHHQVRLNGKKMGEYDVEPGSKMVTIDVKGDNVSTVLLESLTLPTNVYINILEVSFLCLLSERFQR